MDEHYFAAYFDNVNTWSAMPLTITASWPSAPRGLGTAMSLVTVTRAFASSFSTIRTSILIRVCGSTINFYGANSNGRASKTITETSNTEIRNIRVSQRSGTSYTSVKKAEHPKQRRKRTPQRFGMSHEDIPLQNARQHIFTNSVRVGASNCHKTHCPRVLL